MGKQVAGDCLDLENMEEMQWALKGVMGVGEIFLVVMEGLEGTQECQARGVQMVVAFYYNFYNLYIVQLQWYMFNKKQKLKTKKQHINIR